MRYRFHVILLGFALAAAGCASKTSRQAQPQPPPAPPGPAHKPTAGAVGPAGPAPKQAAAPKTVQLAKDTVLKTASGAAVTVPARWHVTRHKDHIVLQEPEKELWMALSEEKAPGAKKAIVQAWNRSRPGFTLKEKQTVKPPAQDGWDVIVQVTYHTPTDQQRAVFAAVRGKAGTFYVALVDGKVAAFSRRGAQMMTVLTSLKASGVQEESFAGKNAHPLDAARLQALETFFEDARKKLKVVGAAMALVQSGKVVYEKGFGVRRLGSKQRVTPNTLFMIGSISKSLTTMMMAKLVDEGKFAWETPVTTVYSAFGLADPGATRQCRMKHTVCACTGLPRQDMEFLFEFKGQTPEKRMALLKTMKPTTGFGETFQYSNVMVAAGGYVAAHAAYPKMNLGPAYLKAMKTRLFGPASMKRTTFDTRAARRTDHAEPHAATLNNEWVPIPLSYENAVVSVGPAGGAWSNVRDMARYLLVELGKGKTPEGRTVVSEANLLARRMPQARISDKAHYGLALVIQKSRGITRIGHGGGTLGFTTYMFFIPEHGVGMTVMTNCQGGGGLIELAKRKFLEVLFDGRKVADQNLAFILKQRQKNLKQFLARTRLDPDRAWLEKLAGTYHSPSLGRVSVRIVRGKGVLDAGEWKAPVAYRKEKDGAEKLIIGQPLAGLAFVPGSGGGKRTLTLHHGQHTYVFEEAVGRATGKGARPRPRPRPRRKRARPK